jgi:predicted nucleic acid-binding protein
VIYLDTSVLLAHLLAEDRTPPPELWDEPLIASRLVEYEASVRLRSGGLWESHAEPLRQALARIGFLEMVGPVLERASAGFRGPRGTLDALHLASADFLRGQGASVRLASYDERLLDAARDIELPIHPLP